MFNLSSPISFTLLFTVAAFSVLGETHYVAISNATPVAPYASWGTAATNIQDAVDAAMAGDTVLVGGGVYATGGRAVYGSMTNRVAIIKPVTVQSVTGPDLTMIVGQGPTGKGAVRCAYLTNGASLVGFTLTDGHTLGLFFMDGRPLDEREMTGGGVWCETGAVVSNCVLTGNDAGLAGGGSYGDGTLNHCRLTGNDAFGPGGGGGACGGTLNHCIVSANGAAEGGGASMASLSHCVISGNSTYMRGGGVRWSTLTNCLVYGNSGGVQGGGAYGSTLINCTVTGNALLWLAGFMAEETEAFGDDRMLFSLAFDPFLGGLDDFGGGNGTPGNDSGGGGVYGGAMINCIVYERVGGGANWMPYDVYMDHCCTSPLPLGEGNIDADPMFVSAGDLHLQARSPCINAGISQDWMSGATDMEGQPRIQSGAGLVDMGAYEGFNIQDALDDGKLTWATGGDTNWLFRIAVSSNEVSAAQSGFIGDNAETWLQTSVASSGTLSFRWRTSCEAMFDTLTFSVDGGVFRSLSGEKEWQAVSVFVQPGAHAFRWTYRKGKSGAAGADCGWVDEVLWTPGIPGAQWVLSVASTNGCGSPAPDVGTHVFTNGAAVAASVSSPFVITENAERRLCVGWSRTGILPESGDSTETTFAMTTDSSLTWLWRTQYWLSLEAIGDGYISGVDDWCDAGTTVTVAAEASPGWRFDHWSGDVDGASVRGDFITVPVDHARHLVANFVVFTLEDALDTTNLTWATGLDAPWIPQKVSTGDVDFVVSCPIPDLYGSWLQTAVVGPGTLRFRWRCDSEANYDYLVFYVDGEVWTWLTGDTGWNTARFDLGAGLHTLRWSYWKDESNATGADAGWVDQVDWTGGLPQGFPIWALSKGLDGQPWELFAQDRDADGVANGFEYAFGANWSAGRPLITILCVDGRPVIEVPLQDAETIPYVDVSLKGSETLLNTSSNWALPVVFSTNTAGKPFNSAWYEPVGSPSNAFFRVRINLRE